MDNIITMEMNVPEIIEIINSIRTILFDKEGVSVYYSHNNLIHIQGPNNVINFNMLNELLGQYGCIYQLHINGYPQNGNDYMLRIMTDKQYERLIEYLEHLEPYREDYDERLTYYRNQIARNYFAEKSSYVLK